MKRLGRSKTIKYTPFFSNLTTRRASRTILLSFACFLISYQASETIILNVAYCELSPTDVVFTYSAATKWSLRTMATQSSAHFMFKPSSQVRHDWRVSPISSDLDETCAVKRREYPRRPLGSGIGRSRDVFLYDGYYTFTLFPSGPSFCSFAVAVGVEQATLAPSRATFHFQTPRWKQSPPLKAACSLLATSLSEER